MIRVIFVIHFGVIFLSPGCGAALEMHFYCNWDAFLLLLKCIFVVLPGGFTTKKAVKVALMSALCLSN